MGGDVAMASVHSCQHDLDHNGFGFWAVQVRASGKFIGFLRSRNKTGSGPLDDVSRP